MRHSLVVYFCLFALTITGGVAGAQVFLPHDFVVEGRLYDSTGLPLSDSNTDVRLDIVSEADTDCSLYAEEHAAVDFSNASDPSAVGVFALQLGTGTAVTTKPSFATLFSPGSLAGTRISNGNACTANSGIAHHRYVRVGIKNAANANTYEFFPLVLVTSVPSAIVAESANSLNGHGTGAFVMTGAGNLTQSNVENVFSSTNYTRLIDLLAGGSNLYMNATPTAAVSMNNQQITNVADPSTAAAGLTQAVNRNYADARLGGKLLDIASVTTGQTLIWNATTSRWEAGSPTLSGAASGDLTGSYPNPTIATGAVTGTKIANNTIATANLTNSTGLNRLVATDAATGTSLGLFTCPNPGDIIAWTAAGWACNTVGTLSPIKTVAGKSPDAGGNIALNANDISFLISQITADAPLTGGGTTGNVTIGIDTGIGANQVARFNSSAQLAPALSLMSQPSYSFNGDLDTGMFSPGSNKVAFSTGGTERLAIDGARIAIGGGTGPAALTISQAPGNAALILRDPANYYTDITLRSYVVGTDNVGNAAWVAGVKDDGVVKFGDYFSARRVSLITGDMERLTVDLNGHVGIGTIAPLTGAALDITGGGANASSVIIPRDTTANRPLPTSGMIRYNTDTNRFEGVQNGAWVNLSLPGGSNVGGDPSSVQFNNGGVLYGTTTFTYDSTNFVLSNNGLANTPSLRMVRNNGSLAAPIASANGDALGSIDFGGYTTALATRIPASIRGVVDGSVATTTVPTGLSFRTGTTSGGAEVMRISSSGRVGIGIPNPGAYLQLRAGNTAVAPLQLTSSGSILATPIQGAVEYDGTDLFLTNDSYDRLRWAVRDANYDLINFRNVVGSTATTVQSGNNTNLTLTSPGNTGGVLVSSGSTSGGIALKSGTGGIALQGNVRLSPAVNNTGSTINYAAGNLQYTTGMNCQAFDLWNLKDGGTYTLVVKNTAATTCSFTAYSDSGATVLTFHLPYAHTAAIATKDVLYTFTVLGNDVYTTWMPGL